MWVVPGSGRTAPNNGLALRALRALALRSAFGSAPGHGSASLRHVANPGALGAILPFVSGNGNDEISVHRATELRHGIVGVTDRIRSEWRVQFTYEI